MCRLLERGAGAWMEARNAFGAEKKLLNSLPSKEVLLRAAFKGMSRTAGLPWEGAEVVQGMWMVSGAIEKTQAMSADLPPTATRRRDNAADCLEDNSPVRHSRQRSAFWFPSVDSDTKDGETESLVQSHTDRMVPSATHIL